MKFHAKTVFSFSVQGAPNPILKELVDETDSDCQIALAFDLPFGDTNVIDFGDMKIAPRVIIVMTDTPIRLDFGAPPPQITDIRNLWAASYTDAAPRDYIHLIGTVSGSIAKVKLFAFGLKLP